MSGINTILRWKVVIRLWNVTDDLSFWRPWQDLFRNRVPVLNHLNITLSYFRIYSEPKVIVMFMSEELIGALHALFRAHNFKVFEHVIKRKWCFSPLLILLMWYIRKQFFTSVSVEMFIWLLEFYVISFSLFALSLPLHRGYFFALIDVFH